MKLEFGTGSRFSRFKLDKAKSLVNHALSKGIRRFDTGYTYGNYKSQPLLAKCLEKKILLKEKLVFSIFKITKLIID